MSLVLALSGCSPAPRPLRYIAVDMPGIVPAVSSGEGRKVEVSKTRVLPNIRLPQDAAEFLRGLHQKTGMSVLRDADLKLTTSVCLFLCVNTDTATAEEPR